MCLPVAWSTAVSGEKSSAELHQIILERETTGTGSADLNGDLE